MSPVVFLFVAAYRGWKVRQCLVIMNDAARVIQQAMLEYSIRRQQARDRERLELEARREPMSRAHSPLEDDNCLDVDDSSGDEVSQKQLCIRLR